MTLEKAAIASAPVVFVVLWSTGFLGAKYGMPYAEPLTFLSIRMAFVVVLLALIVWWWRAPLPNSTQIKHSIVTGSLVHGLYLAGTFVAVAQGIPAGIAALIPGLQPILTSAIAATWLRERVTPIQWMGLVLGLIGVGLVLHDRALLNAGTPLGWAATVASLIGITLGTLYHKRYGAGIDWRSGNLVQYLTAVAIFTAGAFAFETREVRWSGELVFALAWLVLVLSIASVALMYWLIRRSPATGFASLFYLVPATTALMAYAMFGEKLDAISIAGMLLCAAGVFIVSRGGATPAAPNAAASVR